MATADKLWSQFYQSLQQFASTSDQHVATESLLTDSARIESGLIRLAAEQPASVLAQLNLTPRQLTTGPARLLKAMVIGLIHGRKNAWPALRLQNLLQAILVQGAFTPENGRPADAVLASAKALQLINKHQPLIPLLLAGSYANRQPHWHLHPDGPLLALCQQLATLLLPASGKLLSLQQVLVYYRSKFPLKASSNWFNLLQQLPEYETLPGRFAKDKQQQYWFICGMASLQDCDVVPLYVRQFDPANKQIANDVTQLALTDLTLLSVQHFHQTAWLAQLEPSADLLPAPQPWSLQDCQEHSLFNNLPGLSVSAQVTELQKQPLLAQFLSDVAQQSSRQQLPVNRLRHAITMLGQDALADWVAQAELYQYCRRTVNPHQHWLEQLQHCLQQALLLFSNAMTKPLSLHTAGVISRCASCSLWQLPTLSNIALARQIQGQLALGQVLQRHIWRAPEYTAQVRQLLLHYQLPDWADATLSWHSRQPATPSLLLKLSWQLSLSVFCASETNQHRFELLLGMATSQLQLPAQTAAVWQQQLTANSQCYYPLPEM